MRRVVVYPDAATVATATAARLLTVLADLTASQERVDIVLTGGTVGTATLAAVGESPLKDTVPWEAVHLWWGDERFVAAGDKDRNEGQAQGALLDHLPSPSGNVQRIGSADDFGSPETATAAYHDELARSGNPEFDVLMLGLGPDGHVASLFPGHDAYLNGAATVLTVTDSPKPPPIRVTLGLSAINRAKRVWVVAAGEEKSRAVAECLQGNTTYPGAAVAGTVETLWLIDVAAASRS